MSRLPAAKWTYRAKKRIVRFLGPLGFYAGLRYLTKNKPRILMYHRFGEEDADNRVSTETFRYQVRYLKKHFSVVSMRDIADQLQFGDVKPNQAVITVDDGYADFHDIALPVLIDEQVPATFFVTTKFVGQEIWLWPDKLEFILNHAGLSIEEAKREWNRLVDALLDHKPDDREDKLGELAVEFGVQVPLTPTAEYCACSWSQLREISEAGIEIGAHTENHPRLTNLNDIELESEIRTSKARIESTIDSSICSFCYPNGSVDDHNERIETAVRDAGFATAVTAYHDGTRGGQYALRRMSVSSERYSFLKSVAGAPLL